MFDGEFTWSHLMQLITAAAITVSGIISYYTKRAVTQVYELTNEVKDKLISQQKDEIKDLKAEVIEEKKHG